jgi:hypothetical protein
VSLLIRPACLSEIRDLKSQKNLLSNVLNGFDPGFGGPFTVLVLP